VKLLDKVKQAGQDFEWYPTTTEIIQRIIHHAKSGERSYQRWPLGAVLDIGAGNGKVLRALREADVTGDLYAIEKSPILIEAMPADVFIVGTDFWQQSLFDKAVETVFCNPPYSAFEAWATRIIRETAAQRAYLVIPARWAKSAEIAAALEYRNAEAKVLGSFDFEDAEDRKARAKVDLVYISFHRSGGAFEQFFAEEFGELKAKFYAGRSEEKEREEQAKQVAAMVPREDLAAALVEIYSREMDLIRQNHRAVCQLDANLLRAFDISPEKVAKGLQEKLKGLKNAYWHELFSNLDKVKNRLTAKSRKSLLDVLFRNTHVDFTLENIYAVLVWIIKQAGDFIDQQLIETYLDMVDSENVFNYKSNERLFRKDHWRYAHGEDPNSHYGLELRIVAHRTGGICTSSYSWESRNGLTQRAFDFIGDMVTIANNLGFHSTAGPGDFQWIAGKAYDITGTIDGAEAVLFNVRAFQNGNLHLRFAKPLMMGMNVEFGRLKGWIKTPAEAAQEIDPDAARYFGGNLRLTMAHAGLMALPTAEAPAEAPAQPSREIQPDLFTAA
jgi:predicted RNA methylase